MVMALTSFLLLLSGVDDCNRRCRDPQRLTAAARAEILGGSLLATGLVLLGFGIQKSLG